MHNQVVEVVEVLKSRFPNIRPRIGMILGTGLASVAGLIKPLFRVNYSELPYFPRSTVESHKGALVYGTIADRRVIVMEGRFHLYEGYSPSEIALPIRAMSFLGVEHLLISSAVGGLNPRFSAGDLMVVTDHINFTGNNPLVGPHTEEFGPRFPGMTRTYPPELV